MSDLLTPRTQTRTAMIVVFVAAVAMLIGGTVVFSMAYNEVKGELDKAPTPVAKPGEPPVTADKSVGLGDAFSKATGKPFFWFTLLGTISLAGLGLLLYFRQSTATETSKIIEEDRQWAKLSYFTMFSVVGFLTVVCLALPYTWTYSEIFLSRTGWSTGENRLIPWLILLAYIVGLGSMFGSLLAIKSEERTSAGLRRWIYGYNAFLGSLLFLAILGIANAFFALYGPEPSDWTKSNIYSLSPAMKKLMKTLEKPTRAYVILRSNDALDDVLSTLANCKQINSLLDVVQLPFVRESFTEIDALVKKYDVLRDSSGLALGVLLVQDPDSAKPLSTFIKREDLVESNPRGDSIPAYTGEIAIYNALREFRQEKKKMTIYFTQDSGELSIDEQAAQASRNATESRTCVLLKQKLEKAGYLVKPLNLSERNLTTNTTAKVPDDALAVIVADPLRMTPEKAKVLDDYMSRPKAEGVEPGKLIVYVDPHFGPDNKVLPTGLESLLMKFGVQIGQDVIYSISGEDPKRNPTVTELPDRFSRAVDAEIFSGLAGLINSSQVAPLFRECRTVKSVPQQLAYEVRPLFMAYTQAGINRQAGPVPAIWTETEKKPKPNEYVEGLLRTGDLLKLAFQEDMVTFGVTVRERGPQQPQMNPNMPPPPSKPGAPRMLVFGDATFITDPEVASSAEFGANLLQTNLAWIRGKPELDSGEVPPKERKSYRLMVKDDALTRIRFLPPLWLLLAVISIGVGVAILRRR